MKQLLNDRRLMLPVLATALVIAVGSVLIVFLTGDPASGGSGSAAAPPASSGAAADRGTKIDIADFKYAPPNLTVKAGAKITWTNKDSAPHTATADGDFDTGSLKQGQAKTVTLKKPGSYSYVCSFHPFMNGKVAVK